MKYVALCLCICSLLSCKKSTTDENGNIIVRGNNNLYITAMHHSWPVAGISVFMKKDASTFPGTDTTLYPFRAVADASGNVLFQNLVYGRYFIYAKGFDTNFGSQVRGELAITISDSTAENHEAYYTMLVSE